MSRSRLIRSLECDAALRAVEALKDGSRRVGVEEKVGDAHGRRLRTKRTGRLHFPKSYSKVSLKKGMKDVPPSRKRRGVADRSALAE